MAEGHLYRSVPAVQPGQEDSAVELSVPPEMVHSKHNGYLEWCTASTTDARVGKCPCIKV